jgi:hypothetical protein
MARQANINPRLAASLVARLPVSGNEQSSLTIFLSSLLVEVAGNVRSCPHVQSLGNPGQRHRRFAPEARSDVDLLRVALPACLLPATCRQLAAQNRGVKQ